MKPDRVAVEELIYESCSLLDQLDFAGFMKLCHPEFRYLVTAYSPEIRKEMTLLDRDRAEMESFFEVLPRHNSDRSRLTRNATVYRIEVQPGGRRARAVSAFQIYRTALDGGGTTLFAVGRYADTLSVDGGLLTLLERRVELVTRDLGWGFHVPL